MTAIDSKQIFLGRDFGNALREELHLPDDIATQDMTVGVEVNDVVYITVRFLLPLNALHRAVARVQRLEAERRRPHPRRRGLLHRLTRRLSRR